jgi:16S rRNA (cytidine1402-2'-O)-methyltransferase
MIFYEAPHKLAATLSDMLAAWGDRRISIVRELTKIHEEVIRTTLSEAAARYADGGAKGEIVLVIEGAPVPEQSEYTLEDAISLAKELAQSGISLSDAAKQAARETGYKKGELYKAML